MLHSLLERVSTYDIIEHIGIPLTTDAKGAAVIECPVCKAHMRVGRSGFVCSNRMCDLLACSGLDMLCVYGKENSYKVSVQELRSIAGDWRDGNRPKLDVESYRIGMEAETRRRLFGIFIRSARSREQLGNRGSSQIYNWMVKKGLAQAESDMTMFVMSPADIADVNSCLKVLHNKEVFEIPDSHVLLIPYFGAHHDIVRIFGASPFTTWEGDITLASVRYAYTGLIQASAAHASYHLITAKHYDAAAANAKFSISAPEKFAMAVHYNPASSRVLYLPPGDSIYHAGKGKPLLLADQLRKEVETMQFSADALGEEGTSWSEFLIARLTGEIDGHGRLTEEGSAIFSGLRIEQADRQAMLAGCLRAGFPKAAQDLKKLFQTNQVFETSKHRLFSSPEGYQLQSIKGGPRDTISNFTVEMHSNVVFREEGRLYHKGSAAFAGVNYPLLLSARDLETPAVIEDALQQVTIKSGLAEAIMPVVRDRGAFKTVISYLREQVGYLPHVEGVESLGWNFKRDAFYGPCWRTDMDGTKSKDFCFNPENPLLEHFSNRATAVVPAVAEVPHALRDLMSMLVAYIVRAYLNYPTKGVLVQHTPAAQAAFEIVFGHLGQTRGISRINYESARIQGFPLYGFNYNAQQASKLGLPLVSLSGQGMHMASSATEADANKAGAFIRKMLPEVCEWLLATAGEGYARKPHILYASELIEEGAGVLAQLTGEAWPVAPVPFACVEKILRETAYEELPEKWVYDFEAQKIRYEYNKDDELVILNAELRSLMQSAVMGGKYFEMDAGSAFNLLGHFYGREPQLPLLVAK